MVSKRVLLICWLFGFINICSGYTLNNLIPKSVENLQQVAHTWFLLGYSEKHEQPAWTLHRLDAKMIKGKAKRSGKFSPDDQVDTGSAEDRDYKNSGYDRGHLVPAADMKWSQQAMNETFFYSNMSPQNQDFNRGIWQDLEEQVRSWAEREGELYIYTGSVLNDNLPVIGYNEVSIPKYYYKIVARLDGGNSKAVAFLIPNQGTDQQPVKFLVSIDKIESLTRLDFLASLPDNLEKKLEAGVDEKRWNFYRQQQKSPRNSVKNKKSAVNLKKINREIKRRLNEILKK